MPAISVIVPVSRAEAFLKTCTDSILGQTFGDLELLLVDDGSPDRSGALCDAIAAADSRVRVFHRENGGVSAARNLALEKAEGEYVYFVDSDDWIAPDTLETLYTALRESGADTAGCGLRYVDQNKVEGAAEPPILPAGVYGREEIQKGIVDRMLGDRLSRNAVNGYVVRFLFQRSLLEGMAFQGAYLEDELFLMEYFCRAGKLVTVDVPLYYYYWNPASATHHYMPGYLDTFRSFLSAKEALAERCGLTGRVPLWRENTCWAGLLIAVSNEFAPGNGHTAARQRRRLKALAREPEFARAMAALTPSGMGRNKQIVADLLRRRQYGLLTLLYRMKNRSK